jgi:hypothetical protein
MWFEYGFLGGALTGEAMGIKLQGFARSHTRPARPPEAKLRRTAGGLHFFGGELRGIRRSRLRSLKSVLDVLRVPAARPRTRHFRAEHVAGKARSGRGAPWRQLPPGTARGPRAKTAGGGVVRNVLIAVLEWLAIWNCRALTPLRLAACSWRSSARRRSSSWPEAGPRMGGKCAPCLARSPPHPPYRTRTHCGQGRRLLAAMPLVHNTSYVV